MRTFLWILIGLLGVDVIAVGAWTALRLSESGVVATPAEVSPFLVSAGVFVALASFAYTRSKDNSKDYLDAATDLLSKAYESLAPKVAGDPPKATRIAWLTAARLIVQAESTATLISEDQHKKIWIQRREYWRGRLGDLIQPNSEGLPEEYFAEKPEHFLAYTSKDREPLSLTSIAVLYHFIRWPEGLDDPLSGQPRITGEEAERWALFGPKSLGSLLVKYHELKNVKKGA